MVYNKYDMLFSCESCPKGKQFTPNPRQDHMKITYHIYYGDMCFSFDVYNKWY